MSNFSGCEKIEALYSQLGFEKIDDEFYAGLLLEAKDAYMSYNRGIVYTVK